MLSDEHHDDAIILLVRDAPNGLANTQLGLTRPYENAHASRGMQSTLDRWIGDAVVRDMPSKLEQADTAAKPLGESPIRRGT